MDQPREAAQRRPRPETGKKHYALEAFGVFAFFVLALLIAEEVLVGVVSFGYAWLLPLLAVLAYLAADLLSGFVHFLADNFGSAETNAEDSIRAFVTTLGFERVRFA